MNQDRINGSSSACPFTKDVADYVIGNLDEGQRAELARHLASECPVCSSEREQFAGLVAELDRVGAPSRAPRPDLSERLYRRIEEKLHAADPAGAAGVQVWRDWVPGSEPAAQAGLVTVMPDESDWQPIDVPGIRVRQLFVDPARDLVTMLVRMEPGAEYPPHRHADVEECYVVAGTLDVAGQRLHAGAYQRAESGSVHEVQSTVDGCTLLIVSSTQDELLAS